MRISIQACIQGEGSEPSRVITVGVVDGDPRAWGAVFANVETFDPYFNIVTP
jgi:hypothetical protein